MVFIYPIYKSFEAVEQWNNLEMHRFIIYWLIFGFLNSFNKSVSYILSFTPIPYLLKSLMFIYFYSNITNGY